MNPPKEGSRKRIIFDLFKSDGPEAAVAKASAMGLAKGTIRSWLGTWGKGTAPLPVKPPKVKKPAADFDVSYQYASKAAAKKAAEARAELNKMHPSVFSIKEKGGRYAIVPRHMDRDIEDEQFQSGEKVYHRCDPDEVGTIIAVGDEVSEVRFPGGIRRNVTNTYLMRADD